ncbi:MAG: aspartyl protease family protein, partial [Acidobacteriota bacterium]
DGAVSFELVRDSPVVVVRLVNGKVPMKFVLDTGSGITVISQKAAKRLGLKPITKGGMARAIGGSGKFEIVYGFVRSMDIGDARVRNIPVYIREFHETSDEIDGYIGLSLISKFLTTVDYGSKRLSLVQKKSIDETSDADSPILPLRLTSSGFLSGEVHLEGIESPFNFIVDTGASVSVITPQVTALEELNSYLRDERMRVVGAAGVIEDVRSFILPKMTFGPHSVKSVRAIELDLEIINEASGFRQTGILGGNFLKNYRITFDFQKSRVVFTPILPAS